MNKKLIAAAIAAGLAAPMWANAAPTLYGHLQAEIADVDQDGTSNDLTIIEDNKRGRLGVKGDEDLGGGLSAIYMFEWQVETTQGEVSDGDRESWVGLKGGFGQVTIGANKSPYKYYGGVTYDALVTTVLEARGNGGGMFSGIGNAASKFGANSFLTDSVSYKNKFGPAEFWVTYQMAESSTTDVDDNLVLGLKLNFGSFEVIAAHAAVEENGANADSSNTKIGGKFKFGSHSVAAQFETHDDDQANRDADAMFVSAVLGFGKNEVILQWGETDSDANGNGGATADRDYLAAAFRHKFSKQTSAWVGYKTTDHTNGDNSLDHDALSAGMRITF